MWIATIVSSALLARLLLYSAVSKLRGEPDVVAAYARVGVSAKMLPYLAALLLAESGGLVAGLYWAPLGLAAGLAVALYFGVAIAFHIRSRELATVIVPVALLGLAIAHLALRIATRALSL
jgi:hypothetical protein